MVTNSFFRILALALLCVPGIELANSDESPSWDPLDRFYAVSKRLHNLMQAEARITDEEQLVTLQNSEHHIIAQKKLIPQNAIVFIKGDIHGDNETIPELTQHLFKEDLISKDLVLKPHVFLVFLGDYIDRGPNSVEVIRQITKLKKNNPNNVILLRGNHETRPLFLNRAAEKYDSNKLSRQLYQIPSKYHQQPEQRQTKINQIMQELNGAFSLMPQIAFLGYREPKIGVGHYIACFHGGIPQIPNRISYPLGSIGQAIYHEDQLLLSRHLSSLRTLIESPKISSNVFTLDLKANRNGNGYTTSPYLWNDFLPTDDIKSTKSTTPSARGRHFWSISSEEAIAWLTNISTPKHIVHFIVRGHQQSPRELFQVKGHEGLAIRNQSNVLTLDYSPRVKGFKSSRDVYLVLRPDASKKSYFHKQLTSLTLKNGEPS